ncbi:dihydroneopterin aldolase [Lactococcus kimchii]|uniref:dihydroneopterin aldolase n=1 Tax=Lactococcus sp. S-13 TaxID=2507158 RepID=UPI0010235DF2|nr:dihydroneopterin aldolase [Lactococcus sp. S-13]RZI48177.1 dihydroneopterin aldolase [Lactococcus sp. S-13]
MYKIKLNNMKFKAHIGVLPEEKVVGQNIEVDLIVETNFDFSGLDQLEETLSYVDFYEATAQIIATSRADLIENLAFEIIRAVKASSERIAAVEIHLRKLAVPIEGIFDSAEIEMRG